MGEADLQPGLLSKAPGLGSAPRRAHCATRQLIVDELTIWIYFRTASKGANVAILTMFIGEAMEVPQGHISWKAPETWDLPASTL